MGAGTPVHGQLKGHLTEEALANELSRVADALRASSVPLPVILDCTEMEGYDLDARRAFVEWNRASRERVTGIAIITDNRIWHFVISAMALAARQRMKGFDSLEDAKFWLQAGTAPP